MGIESRNIGMRAIAAALMWAATVIGAGLFVRSAGATTGVVLAGAGILAVGLFASGAIIRSFVFPARAILLAGAILGLGVLASAMLAHSPAGFYREASQMATFFWLFLIFIGVSPRTRSDLCNSPAMLVGFAAVLAAGWSTCAYIFY